MTVPFELEERSRRALIEPRFIPISRRAQPRTWTKPPASEFPLKLSTSGTLAGLHQ